MQRGDLDGHPRSRNGELLAPRSGAVRIHRRDVAELAAGYASSHRGIEIAGLTAFGVLGTCLAVQIARHGHGHGWLLFFAAVTGLLAADFISGLVHWAGDTWGDPDWPVVGRLFIRTFREHHVDPESITRHDFVETNGDNCLVSAPMFALALWLPSGSIGVFSAAFVLALGLFVCATSQIHKWAHSIRVPRSVAWLQRMHLVLSPGHHAVHHTAPHTRHYCITVGWLNMLLDRIRFFSALERRITALTGALPRRDDIGQEAALALAKAQGVIPAGQHDTGETPSAADQSPSP